MQNIAKLCKTLLLPRLRRLRFLHFWHHFHLGLKEALRQGHLSSLPLPLRRGFEASERAKNLTTPLKARDFEWF